MRLNHLLSASRIATICVVAFASILGTVAEAQRPAAPKFFPENTLAYLRVNDTRELKAQFDKTSMGKLKNDNQIKPILSSFYNSLTSNLVNMTEQMGINMDELLEIPNGELAAALIATDGAPVFCVMLEAGSEMPAVEILLKKVEKRMSERGASRQVRRTGNIDVIAVRNSINSDNQLGYFIDSGVVIACTKVEHAEFLAKVWTGNAADYHTLSENRRFTSIMSRSLGLAGERPQVSFYADPIAIFKELSKANANLAMVSLVLPALGLDGIQALGGSMIFAPNDFDSISHTHLLLDSQRKGLLQVLRPKKGSVEPEKWVHEDIAVYYTLNWSIDRTVAAVRDILDTMYGPDYFEDNVIKGASRFLGINFRSELLDQLDDRLTMVQVFLRPAQINSGSSLYAVHVKDPEFFKKTTLPKIYDKLRSAGTHGDWHADNINNQLVYYMQVPQQQSEALRTPEICFTIIDNCLVVTDSKRAIEDAIMTNAGQREPLSKALEFKLVKDRIKRQTGDRDSSIISYQRPEESLRLFYDLAADRSNQERLRMMAQTNPLFAALSDALGNNSLPPFEVIAKYLAPGGSFVLEDESGLHATSFSLRRE